MLNQPHSEILMLSMISDKPEEYLEEGLDLESKGPSKNCPTLLFPFLPRN